MKKSILAILLALTMVIGLVPITAIAAPPPAPISVNVWVNEANAGDTITIDITPLFPIDWESATIKTITPPADTNIIDSAVEGTIPGMTITVAFSATAKDNVGMMAGIQVEYETQSASGVTTSATGTVNIAIQNQLTRNLRFSVEQLGMHYYPDASYNLPILNEDNYLYNGEVTYTSDNEGVATVANGKYTLKGVGIATITATTPASADGKYAESSTSFNIRSNGNEGAQISSGSENQIISYGAVYDPTENDEVYVNNNKMTITGNKLSGYPGYTGDIGEISATGTTIITLYSDFYMFMQTQNITEFPVTLRTNIAQGGIDHTADSTVRALNTYTASFNANGGTGLMADVALSEAPGQIGVAYQLPDSTFTAPEGMRFVHWGIENIDYVGQGIFDTFVNPGQTYPVYDNIEFFAIWEEIPMYTVSYSANTGTGDAPAVPTDYYEASNIVVLANTFAKDKYEFIGWNTAADGSGTAYNANDTFVMPTSDVVLYAQWKGITDVPKTGDNSNIALVCISMVLALGAIATITVNRRKLSK